MSGDDRQAAMIAHLYIEAFDKHRDRLKMCLHEEATMNWFGRTLNGNDEIILFLNTMVPTTIHFVHCAKACFPNIVHTTDVNNNQIASYDCSTECRNAEEIKTTGNNNNIDCITLKRRLSNDESKNKIVNLINVLAGIEEVNIVTNYKSLLTKMPKQTPHYGFSLVFSEPEDRCDSVVNGIVIKGRLFVRSKSRVTWERKIDHIYLECVDNFIKTIIYKGASSCRRNLSKIFENM